jgi:PhoPQ-activated pathogenicity-related protein
MFRAALLIAAAVLAQIYTCYAEGLKVVLIGASKRGWTKYLTAAEVSRIMAMVPAVFEMVSMEEQITLMRERYGRDTEKIRPYTALGLTNSLREPRVAQLIS